MTMETNDNNFHATCNDCLTDNLQATMEALSDNDIAVFDELGRIPAKNIHTFAYIIVACLGGKGQITIEGRDYEITHNDVVISHPNQFIENAMVSCDFKCRGLLMSPQYFKSVFYLPGKMWKAGFDIRRVPVLHLSDAELEGFMVDCDVLKYKLAHTDRPHHKQAIKLLLQSQIYDMYDILAPKLQLNENVSYGYSSGEALFGRFINLITAESPCRHSVIFYADKLCITPKYLSSICKKQTGNTASDLIDEMTVNYIKQMLRSSDKSIKQIATDTGFDNLSFFGKFVRRKLGVSPRDYRTRG